MDKMREEFEDWAVNCDLCTFTVGDEYKYMATEWAWRAWKASRAAICVELPEKMNPEVLSLWDIGFNEGIESAMDCMQEAGVTCK